MEHTNMQVYRSNHKIFVTINLISFRALLIFIDQAIRRLVSDLFYYRRHFPNFRMSGRGRRLHEHSRNNELQCKQLCGRDEPHLILRSRYHTNLGAITNFVHELVTYRAISFLSGLLNVDTNLFTKYKVTPPETLRRSS